MKPADMTFEKFREWTIQQFGNCNRNIDDVRNFRLPSNTDGKIDNLFTITEQLSTTLADLNFKINALMTDNRFIYIFTDEHIKDLYMSSGLGLKDVARKFNTSEQNASKLVKGKVKDVQDRHKLGMYLRIECAKNKEKVKKEVG